MLDKNEVMNVSKAYAREVRKLLNPDKVLLFGSYAKGNAREWSDIDIAVIMYGFNGNWLKTSAALCRLCENIGDKAAYYIEPHLVGEGDEASGFLGEILRTGIPLVD